MRFLFGKMGDFLTLNLSGFTTGTKYPGTLKSLTAQEHLDSSGDPVLHFNFSLPMKKKESHDKKRGAPKCWLSYPP